MTLDERIKKDLTELYEGKEISSAKELASVLEVSTRGLPQHFVGDRNAKTVFVQLNPGGAVGEADAGFKEATKGYDRSSCPKFIGSYVGAKTNYGKNNSGNIKGSFDLKQTAFLSSWTDSGIEIPADFPQNLNSDNKKEAIENVLMQKLQLELVPYCSSRFEPNALNIHLFEPYLETLLDEIFRVERKYVIFGGGIFVDLLKNMNLKNISVKLGGEQKVKLRVARQLGAHIAEITKGGEALKAVVARTFPRKDIANAYDVMADYGNFCFEELNKALA